MLISKKGATMIELMAVLSIMGLGIAALLQTIGGWVYYARDTENNIKAINIAREGIEGMINIRDTNWLRFSSDKTNCWKTDRYDATCIWNTNNSTLSPTWTPPITNILSGSYTIFPRNGVWLLSGATSGLLPASAAYKSIYKVWLDTGGFYTQTGVSATTCSNALQANCLTIFTREIQIGYTQTGVIQVLSTVNWLDRRPQNVTLGTTLTNWKSNF